MNTRVQRPVCWPRFVAADVLISAGVALGCMLSYGCGGGISSREEKAAQPEKESPAEPARAAEPSPQPIRLGRFKPVTVEPGEQVKIELQVERAGNEGPIGVEVAELPKGLSVKPLKIPAEESSGQLELSAAKTLGNEKLAATLLITVKLDEIQAQEPLSVTVDKVNLPRLLPPAEVILQPGAKAVVNLSVQRNGYAKPLQLRVVDLPEKVTGKVQNVAAGQQTTRLELTAAAGVPNGRHTVRVVTVLWGRTIDVKIPLVVEKQPYRVDSLMVVKIKPGETRQVEIPVLRQSYQGPLHLEAAELPEGVSAPPVELGPSKTAAKFEFTAAEDAKERVRSVKIISTGGSLRRTDPLVLRVSLGESGFLPRAITADRELFPLLRRGSFGGRLTTETKQALLEAYGGTPESEEAVLRGLRWLAGHQNADGRWSLKEYGSEQTICDCQTDFEKEVVDSDTAGTAFGVLPFLSAGITHNRAPDDPPELAQYQKMVYAALAFLVRNQVVTGDEKKTGDLGGNLYAHALGTMALCEAYGLSGDHDLKVPAQLAVKHLVESQHLPAGGWRYGFRQPGDMSATGWMFLAIRCGQLAGMTINKSPLVRAERFVDSCAAGPEGARLSRYAYQPGAAEKLSLTAAGLLTRQYLGWSKDNEALLAGSAYLMQHLPPESGNTLGPIYYYYYATQVLHHMEGSDFDLWNHRMREHLIRTQAKQGHQAGSWNPQGSDWGAKGGRLYTTSLALMTLQVYYRHLPMYRPVKRTQN